jgi:dUTP pyrophosphatase
MKLFVKVLYESLKEKYLSKKNYSSDSGFDLYPYISPDSITPDIIIIPANAISFKIPLGVSCAPDEVSGYYLYPRSSIIKTPLRLSNSIGIIDALYRGQIMAVVDNIDNKDFVLHHSTSLFQLCAPDLKPLQIEFVDNLDKTERGEGGFGSTH